MKERLIYLNEEEIEILTCKMYDERIRYQQYFNNNFTVDQINIINDFVKLEKIIFKLKEEGLWQEESKHMAGKK